MLSRTARTGYLESGLGVTTIFWQRKCILFFNSFPHRALIVSLIFPLIVLVNSYKIHPHLGGPRRKPKRYPVGGSESYRGQPGQGILSPNPESPTIFWQRKCILFFNSFPHSGLMVSLIFALIVLVESYEISPHSGAPCRKPRRYPVGEVRNIADSPDRVFALRYRVSERASDVGNE